MSAAVMPNYYFAPFGQGPGTDSDARVQNWMLAQMAQYPPPPQPDHHHYNALYPASAGAQQLVDPQEPLQYSTLNQPAYAKVESTTPDQGASSNHNINHLAQELHQQAQHGGQQAMQQTFPQGHSQATPQPSQAPSTQQSTSEQNQKANRLRKACDSCSIRKVKVPPPRRRAYARTRVH